MNRPVWRARILVVGGILECLMGLGLLVEPSALAAFILGSPLGGSGVAIGRIAGAGLLSLGIACWCARKTPTEPASGGLLASSASVLHGVLGAALLAALPRRGRSS